MTETKKHTYLVVSSVVDGVDSFGTNMDEVAAVTVDRRMYVCHTSFRRGGCLYAGTAILRNLQTGASREVDLTSCARSTDSHVQYLLDLADKHIG